MEQSAWMEGEAEARQIWERYQGLLFTVTRVVPGDVGRPEDVEECVQDVLWESWQGREKWDGARGSEKTYLCVLARSRARTLRKKLLDREGIGMDGKEV